MQHLDLIETGLEELRAWKASSPEADWYPEAFYNDVARLLVGMSEASATDALDERFNALMQRIVVSGPLSAEFMPSLEELSSVIHTYRKSDAMPRAF